MRFFIVLSSVSSVRARHQNKIEKIFCKIFGKSRKSCRVEKLYIEEQPMGR